MKQPQKNYSQEDKMLEVYSKHIGLNAELQYKPTPREWVLDAMAEYSEQQNRELKDTLSTI